MERDRLRRATPVAIVVSLLLGLFATGLGIAALRKSPNGTSSAVPVTQIVLPSSGSTISGIQTLVARPVGPNVAEVDFLATGGKLHNAKIATGVASLVGWQSSWDTRTAANGTYSIVSIGYSVQGASSSSSSIVVTIRN